VLLAVGGGWWWTGQGGATQAFEARTTLRLGDAGTVVADAGAGLSWQYTRASAVFEQANGTVFYRLEPASLGQTHIIQTPAGRLSTPGGCFTVEVRMRSHLKGALIGAALATAVIVSVYEGRVEANPPDSATIQAGEQRRLPVMTPAVHTPIAPVSAAQPGPADVDARAAEIDALRAERRALKRQLKAAQAKIAEQGETLAHHVGQPLDFPADLDPKYRQEALMERFNAAFEELGIEGGVTDIDCSEYPCLVFGRTIGQMRTKELQEAEALETYGDDLEDWSHWAGQSVVDGLPSKSVMFGLPVYPAGSIDPNALKQRLMLRYKTFWEAERESLKPNDSPD
jgi:hypothetical protein